MQGPYPSRQTPGQFFPATLYAEIGQWVTAVVENVVAIVLAAGDHDVTKDKSLFAKHSEGLTELATLLIDYTELQLNPYYSIMHQNAERLAAAKATIDMAKQCAKRFDHYSHNPQTYDQGDAAVDLHGLLTRLTDLWGWLAHAMGESPEHKLGLASAGAVKDQAPLQPRLPGMTWYEFAGLLSREYSEDALRNLAFELEISGENLRGPTVGSVARMLVRRARKVGKYQALWERVRQEHPQYLW